MRLRPSHRRLLACLLLVEGAWTPTDTLVDRMWGEAAPAGARNTIHAHMSALRRRLPDVISTDGGGYRLDLSSHEFDVAEFSTLVAEALQMLEAGHVEEAGDLAERATRLWRGDPYSELRDHAVAWGERARLTELSIAAATTMAKARRRQGRSSESIAFLQPLVTEHPLNEPLWEELVQAYALEGRQADALRALATAARILREELGVHPGPRLRQLEDRVLLHDPDVMDDSIPVANNLPDLESSFIGRDGDLASVLALQAQSHVVSIIGPPGIGKSRLAVEAAARDMWRFPGGVWMTRLVGAKTDADVAATITAAMGITGSTQELDVLFRSLSSRPALLILDNCEQVLDSVRRFLGGRSRGDALRVLTTSRARLGVRGETVWRLRELPMPLDRVGMWDSPALQLLADRVAGVDPAISLHSADPDELIELCSKTGGVPLAIELAARWVPYLDLDRVAGLIMGPSPISGEPGAPHHTSLAAALTQSVSLLPPSDQWAFDAASTFAGSFTAQGFERVCLPEATADDVAATIGRVVEASLLVAERSVGNVRYRMLEPFREFGIARLHASGRAEAVRDRHAEWMAESAAVVDSSAMGPEEAERLLEADESVADFRIALRHLLDGGHPDEALDMAAGLARYWIARYQIWEGYRWLVECLTHEMDDEQRLRGSAAAGSVAFFAERYDESAAWYEECRQIAARTGDLRREAEALYGLGRVEVHRRPQEGRSLLNDAIGAFQRVGLDVLAAECRLVLGIEDALGGRSSVARETLTRALDVLEDAGYPKLVSVAHRNLSLAAWYEDDEREARIHLATAESYAQRSGDRRVMAGTLVQRAMVEGKWGDPYLAATAIVEAMAPLTEDHSVGFCLIAFGAMPLLVSWQEWSMAARLLNHFDLVYAEHGWIPLDQRVAVAAEYRSRVSAGVMSMAPDPDPTPVSTVVMAKELTATLTRIAMLSAETSPQPSVEPSPSRS